MGAGHEPDDRPDGRRGPRLPRRLVTLLARHAGIELVGEAPGGPDAAKRAAVLKPDILVLDVERPGGNDVDLPVRVVAASPRTRVLAASGRAGDAYAADALRRGARGYLLKSEKPRNVVKAIRCVPAGELWAGRKLLAALLDTFLDPTGNGLAGAEPTAEGLTPREREVAALAARGLRNREIGARLFISPRTVKTHLAHIFARLGITRRAQLMRRPPGGGVSEDH